MIRHQRSSPMHAPVHSFFSHCLKCFLITARKPLMHFPNASPTFILRTALGLQFDFRQQPLVIETIKDELHIASAFYSWLDFAIFFFFYAVVFECKFVSKVTLEAVHVLVKQSMPMFVFVNLKKNILSSVPAFFSSPVVSHNSYLHCLTRAPGRQLTVTAGPSTRQSCNNTIFLPHIISLVKSFGDTHVIPRINRLSVIMNFFVPCHARF